MAQGKKSGGGNPRKPRVAPDSAASISYVNIVYGLANGEIAGLANGYNSIRLDGTPIVNSLGEPNLEDVEVEFRTGTNDQLPLAGFKNVVNEIGYNNIEVTDQNNFIHHISDTQFTTARVRLTFGPIYHTSQNDGDVSGYQIDYAIDVQVDGLGFVQYGLYTIKDKTSANYERSHLITLPEADQSWDIRVRRLTPNRNSQYYGDKMYVSAVAEIINAQFNYPNTAVLGLKYDASRFSNIAKLAVRLKGRIIRIPENLDPETGIYATTGAGTTNGTWNGSFKWAYSTNPAWIYYDLLLSTMYGLGDSIDAAMIDKWSLYVIGKYCDQQVPDGFGGTEKRLEVNVYISTYFEAYDLLMQLSGVFRGIQYWDGERISVDMDRPREPVYTYHPSNVIGSFSYSGSREKDRYSVVVVEYDDPDLDYKTVPMTVFNRQAMRELGVKVKKIQAFGCTSRGQAQRAGYWALYKNLYETRVVTFKVGLDGFIAPVGKIIEIADPKLAGRANGGRIAAVSLDKTQVTLDRVVGAVGDRLVINGDDGVSESRDIIAVNQKVVTVSMPFENVSPENTFGIESEDLKLMRFTVVSVTQDTGENASSFSISAVQHEPAIFDAAENDVFIEPRPVTNINPSVVDPVTELEILKTTKVVQGISVTDLVITWKQVSGAVRYDVQWRKDDGQWINVFNHYSNTLIVENVFTGVYQARVVAINAADIRSRPTVSQPIDVVARYVEPPALAFFQAEGILLGIRLTLGYAPQSENGLFVEVQVATLNDYSDVQLLTNIPYPNDQYEYNGLQPNATFHYRARLVDKNQFKGPWSAWVTATVNADPDKLIDIISGHLTEQTLDQALQGKLNSAVQNAVDAKALAQQANTAATNATNAAATAQQSATNALNQANNAITTANTALTEAQAVADDLQSNVTSLQAEIDAETTARLAAINTLNDGLTTETTLRQQGDASLLSNIETYKTSTNTTLSSLQTQINTNATNTSANATAITALDSRVTNAQTTANNAVSAAASAQTTANTAVDLANAASSQTTALRSELSTGNGVNIIVAPFSDPQTVPVMAGSLRTVTLIASPLRRNGKAYNVAFTANTATVYFGSSSVGSAPNGMGAAMTGGLRYSFSLWIKSASGAVPNLKANVLYFRRDPTNGTISVAGAVLTPQGTTNTSFALDTTGRRISFKALTAPSNTIGATYYLTGDNAVPAASGEYVVDWLMAEAALGEDKPASTWVAGSADLGVINDSITTNASAITSLTTRVTTAEGTISSHGTSITSLQNSVTTINNTLATKADASAVSSLTTRVTTAENTITSQGNSITSLNNSVATINNTLSTKADASALNSLTTRVTTAESTISSHGTSITSLQNSVTTINSTLATKADVEALNTLTTRVTAAETGITNNANATTVLNSKLSAIGNDSLIPDFELKDPNSWESHYGHSMTQFFTTTTTGKITNTIYKKDGTNPAANWNYSKSTVPNGKAYKVSLYIRRTSDATGAYYVTIGLYDASGVRSNYTQANIPLSEIPADGQFYLIERTINLTSNAATRLAFGFSLNHNSTSGTAEAQGFRVRNIISQNDIDTTVATASSVSNLSTTVTQQGNTLTSQGNSIVSLQNTIDNVSASLSSKADASAVTSLSNRVTDAENTLTSQGNSLTSLNNSLAITTNTANNALPKITVSNNSYKLFRSVLTYENNALNLAGNIVIQTPITLSAKMFKVTGTGYNYSDSATDISFAIGAYAYNGTSIIRHSATNTGTVPLRMRLGIRNNTVCIILTNNLAGNLWQYPKLSLDAEIGYTLPPDSWQNGWSAEVVLEADLASYGVANIVEPSLLDVKTEVRANATAISSLETTVTQHGNTITSQGTSITSLQNNISSINGTLATKADSSTVSTLTNRVTATEGSISTLNSAVTSLNAVLKSSADSITMSASIDIDPLTEWLFVSQQGEILRANDTSALGGKVYQFGNNSGNDHVNARSVAKIPFDPNRIYRVKLRYKRMSGTGTIYASVCTLANDGTSHVNASNSVSTNFSAANYFVSAANPTNNVWQEVTVFVKGRSAGAASGSWTMASPRLMPNATAFLSLQFLANYPDATGSVYLDYLIIEDAEALEANTATASAVSELTTRVTNAEGTLTSQGSSITSLNNSITTINNTLSTKADAAAVTALTSRVTTAENTLSSQSTSITSLNNSITTINGQVSTINGYITLSDTRSTNETPQWYWTNHPRKIVREFKQASVLGLTGMGTYVTLETQVPWTDSSGGPVVQIARGTDSKLTAERRSTTGTAWAVWDQNIKALNDALLLKADSSAVSSLDSRVTTAENNISAQGVAVTRVDAFVGNQQKYLVVTGRNGSPSSPKALGWHNPKGVREHGLGRGLTLTTFNGLGVIDSNVSYDTYGDVGAASASLNTALQNLAANKYFALVGLDNVGNVGTSTDSRVVTLRNTLVSLGAELSYLQKWIGNQLPFFVTRSGAGAGGKNCIQQIFISDVANDFTYFDLTFSDGVPNGLGTTSNLQSSLNATASAVTSLEAEVNVIDGQVTNHATSITNLTTTVNNNTTTINSQTTSINGIRGMATLTVDVNGVVAGWGLVSEIVNGQVTSSFGVSANNFYIGNPTSNKKPFIVLTSSGTINGVTVPAGTYIDTAFIADLTVTTAKINNLAVTNAKIANLAVDNAKIANLSVSTLKIQDEAVTVPAGALDNSTRTMPTVSVSSTMTQDENIDYIGNALGDLISITVTRSGGKCRIDGGITLDGFWVSTQNGANLPSGVANKLYIALILLRNGVPIARFKYGGGLIQNDVAIFTGTFNIQPYVDPASTGNVTYAIRLGFGTTSGYQAYIPNLGTRQIRMASVATLELKK